MTTEVTTKPKRRTVEDLLLDDRTKTAFQALLPQHFTPERMIRLALMATTRTPKLAECHPIQLLGAFIECAALGLEPNSPKQEVHLIPFWNGRAQIYEIQRVIGYRGFLTLGYRTEKVVSVHADVAYENDEFDVFYGVPESYVRHRPLLGAEDRGKPLASYCVVKLVDGHAFDVVPWSDVLKIRDKSQNYQRMQAKGRKDTPWIEHEDRMGRKTAIRRLFNGGEVPMSSEMAQALAIEDRRMDYRALADASTDEIRAALDTFSSAEEPQEDDASQPTGDPLVRLVEQEQAREPHEEAKPATTESSTARPEFVFPDGTSYRQPKRAIEYAVKLLDNAPAEEVEELNEQLQSVVDALRQAGADVAPITKAQFQASERVEGQTADPSQEDGEQPTDDAPEPSGELNEPAPSLRGPKPWPVYDADGELFKDCDETEFVQALMNGWGSCPEHRKAEFADINLPTVQAFKQQHPKAAHYGILRQVEERSAS